MADARDTGHSPPLKLYWWRARPNFGDAINRRIVAQETGRRVEWAPPESADMLAIGSVLGFEGTIRRLRGPMAQHPLIWGSGFLSDPGDAPVGIRVGMRCLAVRGPLTAACLPGFAGVYGDAGLLCPRLLPFDGPRAGIAYVPHHAQWKKPAKLEALQREGLRIIDVRQSDPWDVVAQIARCEIVLSASLHGLVVADAYGVPNIWVATNDWMATEGAFKFRDYFASVGRKDDPAATLDEALRLAAQGAIGFDCAAGVARAQEDLTSVLAEAFPAVLGTMES
ncbi:MAG: polysaccharide pyruvyl transferase [Rhodobacteraceae bacterium HLUCCA12]|nr:MAG: polysaccharide pyruvyl transferase [Rhodobacteraceae bacterium HLUCCA12]